MNARKLYSPSAGKKYCTRIPPRVPNGRPARLFGGRGKVFRYGRRIRHTDGRLARLSRDLEVLLKQHRRHRKGVTDIVESGGNSIGRQFVDDGQLDGEEIPYRIGVFESVEPPYDGTTRVGLRP